MKSTYRISGMHCRSCELLVAKNIRRISGVTDVRVDHRTGEAVVVHESPIRRDDVSAAVHEAGYELGDPRRRPWISHSPAAWQEFLVAACLVFILFLLGKAFGLSDVARRVTTATGPLTALLIGLTAGISSCMALIGGLVLGISARHAELHPEATTLQNFRPHIFFNLGRVGGFALLGGLAGAVGALLQPTAGFLGFLIIATGIIMLLLGVKLLELFPRLAGGLALPAGIGRILGMDREMREYGHSRAALTGALTFFLPCGFTQAMQVYAISTGSFTRGALIMAAFAVGTAPGLLGVGGLASVLRGTGARLFFKIAGIIVILLGVWNIANGWNLTGIGLRPTVRPPAGAVAARVEEGFQVISMSQWAGGYSPRYFVITAGIPTRWIITSRDNYSCASSLVVPRLGIQRTLRVGENVIELPPLEPGILRFSCSMGMYTGSITVIE